MGAYTHGISRKIGVGVDDEVENKKSNKAWERSSFIMLMNQHESHLFG